jgi:eukaryotic-like serine/threonine-protein kinase
MFGNLGKYRLDARLGGGGMAEVFTASTIGAEGFSRRVAIKRVLPGYSENSQFAQMFVAEAQLSSRLQHPNIVSVLDFDRDNEGRLFLVMELVEGKDLDAVVATGLLPFPVVIFVLTEMLRGLSYAHDLPAGRDELRGLVHRDVSPHNVLLSWEGAVKVSDFGIAKARAASEATASVFIKGKPAYMSPEQANGEPLDGRSDLFAVGIMMWEMLVGRRLFVGGDTRSLLAQVLFSPIPRPRQQRADVPRDLDRICMKMLERELPARYESGEEIIADLLRCEDAPKGGREELVSLLAQRFDGEFPRRNSKRIAARPPSTVEPVIATPTPFRPAAPLQTPPAGIPSPTVLGHGEPVAASHAGQWVGQSASGSSPFGAMPSAMPPGSSQGSYQGSFQGGPNPGAAMYGTPPPGSVDQMMAAHTRTLQPQSPSQVTGPMALPRRGLSAGTVVALVVGALVVLGLVIVVVVMSSGSGAQGPAGGQGGSAIASGSASGAMPVVLDAGAVDAPPDAAPATTAPDAAPSTPPADASSGRSSGEPGAQASSRRGKARVSFTSDPPGMTVWVDGKRLGPTPQDRDLSPGSYRVRFRNEDTGEITPRTIKVEAGKNLTIEP